MPNTLLPFNRVILLLFLLFAESIHTQTLNVTISDATCSSNGSIMVEVIGGSGNYNYQLSGTCLPSPITQSTAVFNNLAPCDYTLTVTDGTTGQILEEVHTVGGDYSAPELFLFCGSCQIAAEVIGGASPFTYSISTEGIGGPFTSNTPSDNPVFDNIIGGGFYWVQVQDSCGNITVEECQSGVDAIENFSVAANNGEVTVYNLIGGSAPFLFTLQSSNGTFTNDTGIFPQSEWGCNMTVTVSDGCTEVSKPFSLRPTYEIGCVNFADGTAEIINFHGISPAMDFICITPDSTYHSVDGMFTGLPMNADFYSFRVIDACGQFSATFYQFLKGLASLQEPVSCDEETLTLVADIGKCLGGVKDFPVDYTCLSCPSQPTMTMSSVADQVVFQGQNLGDWVIAIEDKCGDYFECEDEVILDILSFCDSLQVSIVDRFICDNGMAADRPVLSGDATYVLLNDVGQMVSSNQTGEFSGIVPGFYTVEVNASGCGFLQDTITVVDPEPIDPIITHYPRNKIIDGVCTFTYTLHIELDQGPFLLTGGPDNVSILLDENTLVNECSRYGIADLLPGDYQLRSLDLCGEMDVYLPDPVIELETVGQGNCPGSGSIIASGANTRTFWEDWSLNNNLNVPWASFYWGAGGFYDHYSLDPIPYGQFFQNSSPYTFNNVEPGFHTVYLYTFRSECPIDTMEVFVPESDPIAVETKGAVLCDGAFNTNITFNLIGGQPPFTVDQLDCNDLTQVVGSETFYDSIFVWSDLSQGDYCFRVLDSCSISLDHQVSVQPYQDEIDLIFNCDNTVTLSVDSLDVGYTWLDENNNIVGTDHLVNLPNTSVLTSYSVLIDLGSCELMREIEIPATQLIPNVEIDDAGLLCEGNTDTLTLQSDANVFEWSTGETDDLISITNGGEYFVTVTNDLGCTNVDSVTVTEIPFLIPEIIGDSLFCENTSTDLSVNGFFQEIKWSTGAQANTITIDTTMMVEVVVTDEFGCIWGNELMIAENFFVPTVQYDRPKCFGINDGVIEIVEWSGGVGEVLAELNNGTTNTAPASFTNLPPGVFDVSLENGIGCPFDTTIIFEEPQFYSVELGSDTLIELGDQIQLNPITNLLPADSFLWNPATYLLDENFKAVSLPLENIEYQLLMWDEHGCQIEDAIFIRVDKTPAIYVPSAFSPNGDGINDFFTIYAKSSAITNINRLLVFDRWGEMVFSKDNISPNNESLGWDGVYRGEMMNPAVFVWKAEVEFIDGTVAELLGDVTLIR